MAKITAKQLYAQARSLPAWVEVDAEEHLYKKGMLCGWMGDLSIVGWKDDEEGEITGFNTKPGHIAIRNGNGEFCDDSRNDPNPCKSYSLVEPNSIGKMSALKDSMAQFLVENFVGCLANDAPIPIPKKLKKNYSDCNSGFCRKHHCECMLWFNQECVKPGSCGLKDKQEVPPQEESEQ